MNPSPHEVTQLLEDWSHGDQSALDRLMPIVYEELRRMARRYLSRERAGHTLQTTALVNEAYLKLVDQKQKRWQNRAHFFAVSAQVMRHILVDHARGHARLKRGGSLARLSLNEAAEMTRERAGELLALDEALSALEQIDKRRSRVVELRYFGGLTIEETAEVLHVKPITVSRDWRWAKAWLYRELTGHEVE